MPGSSVNRAFKFVLVKWMNGCKTYLLYGKSKHILQPFILLGYYQKYRWGSGGGGGVVTNMNLAQISLILESRGSNQF